MHASTANVWCMSPTANATTWRAGVIALLMIALLTAAVPIRAQPLVTFSEACPGELEATAQGNGTILLQINASSDVMLYRDGAAIAQVNGTAHTDAEVEAGITYTYHITLLVQGQETPPCDEATVTAKADASAQGDTGNATARGDATANGTSNGNATVGADAAAVLEACPATLHAEGRADGSVLLRVNASAAVDAVTVYRQSADNATHVGTRAGGGTIVDARTEPQVAYTYRVTVTVDGQESRACDAVEFTQMPTFPGFSAVLATAIAGLVYILRRGA